LDFKYFQFASPFQSPRKVLTADNVDKYWKDASGDNTGRSWQFYNDTLNDYWKVKKSPSGFRGESYSHIVPIDIDNSSTDNLCTTLKHLEDMCGLDDIDVFYSGKKGYHIEIPSGFFGIEPSENLPERFKHMIKELNIGADLSLYKANQLYRMNNTLNVSGGCYKTKLDTGDILDGMELEDIKAKTKSPLLESFDMNKTQNCDLIPVLQNLWESTYCPDNTKMKVPGGVNEGKRNANAYDTALSFKTQEYGRETAKQVVEEQNKKNNPPEPNLEGLFRTVDSAYDGEFFKNFPINPVFQHLKEDAYWNELNDKRKVIYLRMLMEANVREHIWMGERIKCNQFIYGKVSTARRWEINQDTLRSVFDKFEEDGIISKRVINQDGKHLYTIITILSFYVTHNFTHSSIE